MDRLKFASVYLVELFFTTVYRIEFKRTGFTR